MSSVNMNRCRICRPVGVAVVFRSVINALARQGLIRALAATIERAALSPRLPHSTHAVRHDTRWTDAAFGPCRDDNCCGFNRPPSKGEESRELWARQNASALSDFRSSLRHSGNPIARRRWIVCS